MSNYDGTGEKRGDGGDSGAFRGRRHPFLDRRVDWKAIDKARHGGETGGADFADRIGLPREVAPFQLTNGPDPRDGRVETCAAAVKQLATNTDKWYVIKDCLVSEYQSAGPDPASSERALTSFIGSVNQRLGSAGEINVERVSEEVAAQIAAAESISNPQLSLSIRVWHSGGIMGPIGVCFTNLN
jgi:hypothetical protein